MALATGINTSGRTIGIAVCTGLTGHNIHVVSAHFWGQCAPLDSADSAGGEVLRATVVIRGGGEPRVVNYSSLYIHNFLLNKYANAA